MDQARQKPSGAALIAVILLAKRADHHGFCVAQANQQDCRNAAAPDQADEPVGRDQLPIAMTSCFRTALR